MMSRFGLVVIAVLIGIVNGQADGYGQCQYGDGYFPTSEQCDAYIHCVNGTATQGLCEDGLVFTPPLYFDQVQYLRCHLPFNVDCSSRPGLQQPQPTADCPRKHGYFAVKDCGEFMQCHGGIGHRQKCPTGLAYNDKLGVCDWFENVERCDASAYFGFSCPQLSYAELFFNVNPMYAHQSDCKKFYTCVNGVNLRLGQCGYRAAFDQTQNTCRPAEEVRGCENYYPAEEPAISN